MGGGREWDWECGEGGGFESGEPSLEAMSVSLVPSSNWPNRSPPTQVPFLVALEESSEPVAHLLSPKDS